MEKKQDYLKKEGLRLTKVRQENGFSQNKLSLETGISRSTIAKYEMGIRSITDENLRILDSVIGFKKEVSQENQANEVIKNLNKYQEVNGISKKEISKLTGIDYSTLTKILNGKRKPSEDILNKINLLFSDSNEKMTQKISNLDGSYSFPRADKEKMGKRIHKIRKDRDESLENFGKNLSQLTGKNVVSRWEKGINIPDIEKLMNIAFLGDSSVSFLLYGHINRNMLITSKRKNLKYVKLDPVYLGRRLRKIRRDYRLEREEFGKLFDPPIRKWSMDRYENGKDIPNTERIIQYAFLGKVSLEFLIYGK